MAEQLFSNNASTTLTAPLTTGSTSASVLDGSVLTNPTGGQYELVTLVDSLLTPTQLEIIKITQRITNTLTVVREQEGTTSPASWPETTFVVARTTAGSLQHFVQNDLQAVVIGEGADVNTGASGIAIGNNAVGNAEFGVVLGADSTITAAADAIIIGPNSSINTGANESVAIGSQALVNLPQTAHIAAAPIMIKDSGLAHQTDAAALQQFTTSELVVGTKDFDLTSTADDVATIAIPTGAHLYPTTIEILITSSDTVTDNPDVSVGTASGTGDLFTQTEITKTDQFDRTSTASSIIDGITGTVYISVKFGGTATALTGRVLLRGWLIEDE